jgi:hypothetical protein
MENSLTLLMRSGPFGDFMSACDLFNAANSVQTGGFLPHPPVRAKLQQLGIFQMLNVAPPHWRCTGTVGVPDHLCTETAIASVTSMTT